MTFLQKARRYIYAEAASRGLELRKRGEQASEFLGYSSSALSLSRLRSGSGTSESTTDYETSGASLSSLGTPRSMNRPHQSSLSSSTSSRPSNASDNAPLHTPQAVRNGGSNSTISSPSRSTFAKPASPVPPPKGLTRSNSPMPPPKEPSFARNIAPSRSMQQLSTAMPASQALVSFNESSSRRQQSIDLTLSPVASRMLRRDADAMAHFMSRNPLTSLISSMDSRAAEYQHPPPSPSAASTTSTSGGNGSSTSTSASNKPQHRFIRSLLRPSVSANALRARNTSSMNGGAAASITPTTGASSRLRSTTLDHTPTGSGAESTSGSEVDATNVSAPSKPRNTVTPSAAMAPSLSLGSRSQMANTNMNGLMNSFADGAGSGHMTPSAAVHPRERRTKLDIQLPASEPFVAGGRILPHSRV